MRERISGTEFSPKLSGSVVPSFDRKVDGGTTIYAQMTGLVRLAECTTVAVDRKSWREGNGVSFHGV